MNGDGVIMPTWLIAAIAALVAGDIGVRLISRRRPRLRPARFRSAPLAAAGALIWAMLGPGPTALRVLTAASGFALTAACEWWFGTGGGPVAMYRRALRRNLAALPQQERCFGVVAWLVLVLTIASIGLFAASAAHCPLSGR